MKRTCLCVLALAWFATPAFADYLIRDGNGNPQTIHALTGPNSTVLPLTTPSDASGNAMGVPGNPMQVAAPTGSTPYPSQVSCGTSATQFLAASASYAVRTVVNVSGSTVYIGGSSVTTATGAQFPSGWSWDLSHFTGAMYCIIGSGSAVISTLQY